MIRIADSEKMRLFEKNIGRMIRVIGTPLTDEIESVDWELMTVNCKKYGGFGVHICEFFSEDRYCHGCDGLLVNTEPIVPGKDIEFKCSNCGQLQYEIV